MDEKNIAAKVWSNNVTWGAKQAKKFTLPLTGSVTVIGKDAWLKIVKLNIDI